MGSTSGGGTTRTEPPKYQLPYLQGSLASAQGLYNQQSGGQSVAPLSSETEQALQGITSRATAGSDVTRNANTLASGVLGGDYLNNNPYASQLESFNSMTNPYLDQTYNRAALQSQNALASQFAGSGRNVDASMGLRSQQLNDLATGIYGGAYENDRNRQLQALGMGMGAYDNERNRQQQTLGMSGQLAQADYADLGQLAQVGATREGYNQELLDAPGNALDQYIGRISGNMGQTTINSQSRNRGAGALGGAMAGAQMGSMFGPWGAGIGGILGGIGGGWG
jgi:hypothetical protein